MKPSRRSGGESDSEGRSVAPCYLSDGHVTGRTLPAWEQGRPVARTPDNPFTFRTGRSGPVQLIGAPRLGAAVERMTGAHTREGELLLIIRY